MNEGDSKSYFDEIDAEIIEEAEEVPESGMCTKCFGSGYVITERNGVVGVVFTSTQTDSEGKPIRKLVPCGCDVEVTY
jgi:hypothetical protein